jgi:hypothetical protein
LSEDIRSDKVLESLLQGTGYLVDFTFEERLKASALNLLFGLGSFLVGGDKFGGGVTAALEGVGTVVIGSTLIYWWDTGLDYPFLIGLGCYVGGAIFGVIRAQIYHKPGSQVAIRPLDGLSLYVVPTAHDDLGYKISYTWKF